VGWVWVKRWFRGVIGRRDAAPDTLWIRTWPRCDRLWYRRLRRSRA